MSWLLARADRWNEVAGRGDEGMLAMGNALLHVLRRGIAFALGSREDNLAAGDVPFRHPEDPAFHVPLAFACTAVVANRNSNN